jgi:hypothetical protein
MESKELESVSYSDVLKKLAELHRRLDKYITAVGKNDTRERLMTLPPNPLHELYMTLTATIGTISIATGYLNGDQDEVERAMQECVNSMNELQTQFKPIVEKMDTAEGWPEGILPICVANKVIEC